MYPTLLAGCTGGADVKLHCSTNDHTFVLISLTHGGHTHGHAWVCGHTHTNPQTKETMTDPHVHLKNIHAHTQTDNQTTDTGTDILTHTHTYKPTIRYTHKIIMHAFVHTHMHNKYNALQPKIRHTHTHTQSHYPDGVELEKSPKPQRYQEEQSAVTLATTQPNKQDEEA